MNESPTWAWKLPAITFDPTRVERALESPHFIVVFKDPLSIALRKSRVGTAPDPLSAMHGVLRRYETILDFAQTTTAPCLLMSFDKAVRDVPAAAAVIAQFCGIVDVPPDIETLVRRDQTAYLAGHQPQTVD
jgi:hypothetical protein